MNLSKQIYKITKSLLLKQNKDFFLEQKYDAIKNYYGPICLDIGTGTGQFGKFLALNGHQVNFLDVTDKTKGDIPVQLFDGKNIPLKDKIADTSLLMFVLHHTNNQIEVISEAQRLAKEYIIIGEDTAENMFDSMMGNIHLRTSQWTKAVKSFRSDQEWRQMFQKQGLELVKKVRIERKTHPLYPISRYIYVLKV